MLQAVLELLRNFRTGGGRQYRIDWKIMNTADYGVPQNRPRIYVVCIRSDALQNPLQWPTTLPRSECRLDDLLGPWRSDAPEKTLPPPSATTVRANVLAGLAYLRQKGINPFKETWILNVDESPYRMPKPWQHCSPCLTRSRGLKGGHWVSSHGGRMGTETMLKLQGMNPNRIRKPDDVAIGSFNGMIGNAMFVNIVEAILAMLSRACPKALGIERPLSCQYATFV